MIRLGLGLRGRANRIAKEFHYLLRNTILRPRVFKLDSLERVGCIYREPSDMGVTDRLLLFALVRGLRPTHALEIGMRWGGSARIITNAMEENGEGALVGIDPETDAFRVPAAELHGRYTLIRGYSPEAIPKAMATAGMENFDFVFIDALHTHDAVKKDLAGVLPYLADGAHIILHDTFHQGVNQAVEEFVAASESIVDCGFLSRDPSFLGPVGYNGLRMLRHREVKSRKLIAEAFARKGRPEPSFDPEIWNWDEYQNRITKAHHDRA